MSEYICKICNLKTRTGSSLARHMRTHTGERPHRCPHCQKAFNQSGDLTRHIRTHTGDRPFPCTVCGKAFTDSSNLNKHMTIHTGEKPYRCTVCGQAFSQSGNRKRHMKAQHPAVTDEVSTTTGSHLLPDGTTATFTTHKFTTADTVTEVSQVRSPTGKAIVTTVESPSAFLTTVSQDSQPTVTTIESEDSSGLLLLADVAESRCYMPNDS